MNDNQRKIIELLSYIAKCHLDEIKPKIQGALDACTAGHYVSDILDLLEVDGTEVSYSGDALSRADFYPHGLPSEVFQEWNDILAQGAWEEVCGHINTIDPIEIMRMDVEFKRKSLAESDLDTLCRELDELLEELQNNIQEFLNRDEFDTLAQETGMNIEDIQNAVLEKALSLSELGGMRKLVQDVWSV